MKGIKTLGNCCLVFLAVIGVCLSLAFCYYHFFVKDLVVGVNNITDQIGLDIKKEEDLTDEEKSIYDERWFMEVNYYSNSKNNGIELQELKFNYFRDWTLTSDVYRSTGMQYVGHYKHNDVRVSNASERDNYVFPQFCYYDTTDGLSYDGYTGSQAAMSTLLKRKTSFTVKIDNRAFEIKLDKYYKTGWWIFGKTHYYTWSELFESAMQSVSSNSKSFGDYYMVVNLSDYFSIYEYDEYGKFKADDVSDIIKNYAVLKFHYDENGARNSTQSMFGSILRDPKYDLEKNEFDTDYSQGKLVYSLNETTKLYGNEIFNYRYSEIYEGYFVSLKMDVKKIFEEMPKVKVKVIFDLQSDYLIDEKINIVGFDYNAFENFEIDTLTIKGNSQTLFLLDKAFYNSKLKTFEHTQGINFDLAENSINNEYVEVIL